MEWIEKTGVSVEAAKEAAIDVLGVAMDEAEFEVVETETVGLFGRVKSPARVRARVLPKAPPPREDRRNRRSRPQSESRGRKGSGSAPKSSGRSEGSKKTDEPKNRTPRRNSEGSASSRPAEPKATEENDAPQGPTLSLEELAASGDQFLTGLMATVGLAGTVESSVDEDRLSFSISGEGLGVLVGRGGRTADAIQELTRAVLLKSSHGTEVRISVDVAGYREIRRAALVDFGTGLAQRAIADGVSIAVDPMGSIDRKTLHDAVQSVEGAESASEGSGPDRRVVVRPTA